MAVNTAGTINDGKALPNPGPNSGNTSHATMTREQRYSSVVATDTWSRYEYSRDRGHLAYMAQAKINENFYLGGGLQWSADDLAILKEQKRPAYEFNECFPAVNNAIGYQISNRMDVAYRPAGGMADSAKAKVFSKVAKHILLANRYHWRETQVFTDGLINQRGYFDVRMSFEDNILGNLEISTLDSADVVPDCDAKDYDPDSWSDVLVTRWLKEDEIRMRYGDKAAKTAANTNDAEEDFGQVDEEDVERNKFGNDEHPHDTSDAYMVLHDQALKRYRVVERQKFEWAMVDCIIDPGSGDIITASQLSPESLADMQAKGGQIVKRMRRQVRWIVCTQTTVLHNEISPYEFFTIVPYFAIFRRGKTRGMMDNAISPQQVLNKAVSQYIHVVNTSANSGWVVEQNSLTNMTTAQLQRQGAMTGLVIEYKQGTSKPEKIQPNQVPSGIDKMIDRATAALKSVTTPDAMRGMSDGGTNESGVLFQAKQFASQQQLATYLDNLNMTRNLLMKRVTRLIQRYYDSYRVFVITDTDPITGRDIEDTVEINKPNADGTWLNDITVGTYDLVITEVPLHITFDNSQFDQAMAMREKGINIPDSRVVRYSSLADKADVIEEMQAQTNQQPVDPTLEAKANLLNAQAEKTKADTVNSRVEGMFSSIQTAQVIATTPATATLADKLMRSAGFVDMDAAPIIPELEAPIPGAELPPENTNPLTPLNPTNPAVGMNEGIETPANDSAPPSA